HRIAGVEARLPYLRRGKLLAMRTPHRGGEGRGHVLGQPQRLADLADGAARAIGDDGGGDAGAVAAVALVDVLDHLLAALVLEIDVDVGRLLPFLRQEAGEEDVYLLRVDIGDAEDEAHHRVRSRAAPLAQDL